MGNLTHKAITRQISHTQSRYKYFCAWTWNLDCFPYIWKALSLGKLSTISRNLASSGWWGGGGSSWVSKVTDGRASEYRKDLVNTVTLCKTWNPDSQKYAGNVKESAAIF